MKITNKKIIKALKNGKSITSKKLPKYCYLKADKSGRIYMTDWGQDMGYNNLHWYVKVFEDNDWEVAQDE